MQLLAFTFALAGMMYGAGAAGNLPVDKIRGVNLGGLFVSEPWMMSVEWKRMGCEGQKSEFDCMMNVAGAQEGFTSHYHQWISQGDLEEIAALGLNTIRVPLGYWIVEETVDVASEHFPGGGFAYLRRLAGWARDAGLNIILVLHGAPGAQNPQQPFTGQFAETSGFYNSDYNYERAYKFLRNITSEVHTDPSFETVFAVEVLNEPARDSTIGDLVSKYYPGALDAIRSTEKSLGIGCSQASQSPSRSRNKRRHRQGEISSHGSLKSRATRDCLQVQFMDMLWGSGEPTSALPDTDGVFFDDHQYVKYATSANTRADLLAFSCADDRTAQADSPVVVGEWSLSVNGDNEVAELSTKASDASGFYLKVASAQMQAYEKGAGWIFWSWKTELSDPRWDYQLAAELGYVPSNASQWSRTACS